MRKCLTLVSLVLLLCPGVHARQMTPITPEQARLAQQHHREGWRLLGSEQFAAARDAFKEALKVNPRLASAYYGLGKANMGLKAYVEAADAFAQCRDVYRAEAGENLTNQMARNQRLQDRIRELDEALREQQSVARQQSGTPAFNRRVQELERQRRQLQDYLRSGQSLEVDLAVPAEIYLSLGSAYFRSSRLDDARREYLNAVKARPDFGEAFSNLAVVALMSGNAAEAQDFVKKAEKTGFKVNSQLKDDIKVAVKN